MKFDVKSLFVGALCVLLLVFFVASSGDADEAGRFQIVTGGGAYPDIYVLDTRTADVYRYLFLKIDKVGGVESIRVESLGSFKKPTYSILAQMEGQAWNRGYEKE